MRVLIVSASMGAGHDGAARELARRLDNNGHDTKIVDFLDAPPLRIGALFRLGYMAQLRFAPWAYQATYRLWYLIGALIAPATWFVNALGGRRLVRWATEWRADAIVSTYPLASLALGRRRARADVAVPVVTFITDFAVHPLLVHRAVDLHLCVHPQSAAKAAARVPGPVRAPGPLVRPVFFARRPSRLEARRRIGLTPDQHGVLIVAGSWGVGDVVEAFDVLAASPRYTPVVVCGRNDALAARLRATGAGIIFDWTDEMPLLMRACDAVVQNAGGLTCMEAFASGLPVVSFRPIPGHGIENAEDMDTAGVAAFVRDAADLVPTLDHVTGPGRFAMRGAARAMFAGDAADDVVEAAAAPRVVVPIGRRRPRVRIAVGAAAAFYATFTFGVSAATAHGVGVIRAPRSSDNVFMAVRLSTSAADDSGVDAALRRLHASAIVDAAVAPEAMVRLRQAGVELDNGGIGHPVRIRAERAEEDVRGGRHQIQQAVGEQPRVFVPSRRLNGYDLVAARLSHQRVVVGHTVDMPEGSEVMRLHARGIYVVDGRHVEPAVLVELLDRVATEAADAHLTAVPLGQL